MASPRLRRQLEDHYYASHGWALHCCRGDHEEAAEVLQIAFLKVLEGKARFDGRSDFKTWLFGVIRNTAASFRRRVFRRLQRWGTKSAPEPGLASVVENALYEAELARILSRLLARLSPRQRDMLHLVFYQEMTVDEAAGILGIGRGSARVHYHRGKERLRRLLEQLDESNEGIWPRRDPKAV